MKELFTIEHHNHGVGKVLFSWQPAGNLLATAGVNGIVNIFDRHGTRVDEISLRSRKEILKLEWDKDGECLAILQEGSGAIPIWDNTTRRVKRLETNLKDPSFLLWSKTGPQLAIGTKKGNLLIYRKDLQKKIPVLGKHAKEIVCGAWSDDNRLALGSKDKTLTISTADGDMLEQTDIRKEPIEIQFESKPTNSNSSNRKEGGKTSDNNGGRISINMDGRGIMLYQLDDPDNPVQLEFQAKYGDIVSYRWFGEGFMMIGFSEGYLVVVSTVNTEEMGEEISCGRFHKEGDGLVDIAYSNVLQRAATCGERGSIKIVDMTNWKPLKEETTKISTEEFGQITMMDWTKDGQILTISTDGGVVLNFLARMPTVHDACETRVAYLSSLREICVEDTVNEAPVQTFPLTMEPSFVGLGPSHVAVGMNIKIWFYRCVAGSKKTGGKLLLNVNFPEMWKPLS